MTAYLDTSALLKRYFQEPGCDEVDRIFDSPGPNFTSVITYAEVQSVQARYLRDGLISSALRETIAQDFEVDWGVLINREIDQATLRQVRILADSAGLKGADLIHLASAVVVAARVDLTFVSADLRLLAAATARGLATLNPAIS